MTNDKTKLTIQAVPIRTDAGYTTSRCDQIGIDAGYTTSKTYVCHNKNCSNDYLIFLTDDDDKICKKCEESVERLTEKHLEPRPGELEALRKIWNEKVGG